MSARARAAVPFVLVLLIVLSWMTVPAPSAADPVQGHLPAWEDGYGWSYEVDHDVDYDLGFIQVNHIQENWTRTVDQVLDIDGEKHYKMFESRRGTLRGSITYGVTFPVTATASGTGWTLVRASDMALVNQTFTLTFSGDLPLGQGKFTGGFDNFTTYDPPMPMLEFPVPTSQWNVRSTVNITTEFFILSPITNSTWYNTSEVWDLNVTATGPSPLTVPAGTYDSFSVHETGTRSNATDTWPVDRRWYYADEALNVVRTYEGHELVWTDAVYVPPNLPPVGPSGPVTMSTDEDVPLDLNLSEHFSDPDGDALTFDLQLEEGSLANATLSGSGGSWTLTPSANWSGILYLQASAADPFGQRATGVFEVMVDPVNDPPEVVWQPHNLATEEDTPLRAAHDLVDVFFDVDGDVLAFTVNSTQGVVALLNGTLVDLFPEMDWTGKATVLIEALDPSGEIARSSFELLVGEVNDPPVIISSGGPARLHETEEGTFWVLAVDTDSDDLEFTWSVGGLTVVGADGPSFTYAPGDLTVSMVTIAITVEDEWNARAELSWDVTIMDSPWIVSTTPSSPVEAEVGDTVRFSIEFEDADTPEPTVRWFWKGDLVGSGEELPLLLGQRDVGVGLLLVVVDDGIGNDTAEWEVNVTVPNEPPTVEIGRVSDSGWPTVGVKLNFFANVEDEDPGSLTILWTIDGTPVGGGFDLSWTPTEAGPATIEVAVDDGEYTASDSLEVTVREAPDDDDDGDTSGIGGLWIPLVLVLVIVVVMVLVYLRTRPGRQG